MQARSHTSSRRQQSDPKVLLVGGLDDRANARVLRQAGYPVDLAPSGLHAQQVLEREHELIGLVITEQDMTGIDGVGLLMLVKSRWPRIRRIIATGRPRGALVMDARMYADARTLHRPIAREKLLTVVKQELDAYAG
jgi:DNA-binding NtrC family response regulator